MMISSTAKYALGVTAAAAMLAGCSSGASSLAPTNPVAGAQASHGAVSTLITQNGRQVVPNINTAKSYMGPDAKKAGQFLYVTDAGAGDVQVYAWPKPKNPVGTLTGFSEPQGACADTKGNVWITSTTAAAILEFKGGATSPTTTLNTTGLPVGCSVDPKTGNLAVTNILSKSYGQGSVDVFAGAKGTPKNYSNSGLFKAFFTGYDNKGVLWVSGLSSGYAPVYASLSAKGKFKLGAISGIEFPGTTQFDGKTMVTGDQDTSTLYQVKKFKSTGTVVFTGASDIVQGWIEGSSFIGPDAGNLNVGIYKYPQGGAATQTLSGFSQPIGSAVTSK
jgi:hypothetical protein